MDYAIPPRAKVVKKHSVVLDCLRDIEKFIEDRVASQTIKFSGADRAPAVLWMLAGRATKIFRAIILLCEQGYGTEAMILARSLMEFFVAINFISEKDHEARAASYEDYEAVIRTSLANKMKECGDAIEDFKPQDWEQLVQDLDVRSKNAIATHGYKDARPGAMKWSGAHLLSVASKLGDKEFHLYYHLASEYVHAFPTVSGSFFHEFSDGIEVLPGPSDEVIIEPSVLSASYMICILKGLNGYLKFLPKEDIDQLDVLIHERISPYLASKGL